MRCRLPSVRFWSGIGFWALALLSVAPPVYAQQSEPNPSDEITGATGAIEADKDEGNVVLSRKLIALTRQLQALQTIQRDRLSSILTGDESLEGNLTELNSAIDQAKGLIEKLATRLDAESPEKTLSEFKSRGHKIAADLNMLDALPQSALPKDAPAPPAPAENKSPAPDSTPLPAGLGPQTPDVAVNAPAPATPIPSRNQELIRLFNEIQLLQNDVEDSGRTLNEIRMDNQEIAELVRRLGDQSEELSRQVQSSRARVAYLGAQAAATAGTIIAVDPDGGELSFASLRRYPQPQSAANGSFYSDSSTTSRPTQLAIRSDFLGGPDAQSLRFALNDLDKRIDIQLDLVSDIERTQRGLVGKLEDMAKENQTRQAAIVSLTADRAKLSSTLESAIKRVETTLRNTELALARRDTTLNQFEINRYLVWAVYAMILVIAIVFFLITFNPNIAEVLVKQRLVLEVLSMSFLLLTIIILGTANLIRGEGLAGLLGTIAGYVFVRKAVEDSRGRGADTPKSPVPVPDPAAKATPERAPVAP